VVQEGGIGLRWRECIWWVGCGRTYSALRIRGHHFGRQGPASAVGGAHGATVCPGVWVLVAIAGAAVPVTLGVVGSKIVVGHGGWC
jgi:hypothetical protein